ncbi:porin [Duganella sp. FT80W]|uniref:Porin n=1 Tax=Duganella guangzhouensis TaxID=2666084 RepID=A0A6I2KXX4_9BURK|nr:porin [Duganella guangzhouensis]MRW89847.1 porin [Duganella guangzhouensis]
MKQTQFLILGGMLLSGACGSAAAQSDVTMYGIIDVGVTHIDNLPGGSKTYMRPGSKDGSRLGFLGSEDLGGGLKAIFKLEAGFNPDDGTAGQAGSLFNRAAYLGLSDRKLGTLTLGRQYSSYFDAINPLGPVPVVTGAAGDHPGDIDGFDITIRSNNAIKYTSPTWHGITASAMVATGEQAGHNGSGGEHSASIKYEGGGWRHALAYQMLKNGPSQTGWDSTASTSFSKSAVNAGYLSAADVQYIAAASRYGQDNWTLGGSFSNVQYHANAASLFRDTAIFNTGAVLASWKTQSPWVLGAGFSYTRASRANGISDNANYRQFSLQQAYWLSSRTSIYILEATQRARGKTLGTDGVSVIDAGATIGVSQSGNVASDAHQTLLGIGLRHAF